MKTKIVLISALAIIILLAAVAPVMASQPKLAFNNTNIGYPDPNIPGNQFIKDNILHVRNQGSVMQVVESPWGVITTTSNLGNNELSLTSFTGSGVSHSSWTCSAGSYEGTGQYKFTGLDVWVFEGTPFTATTNAGGTYYVDKGTMFFGIIFTGQFVGHGIIDGKSMQMRVAFTGLLIIDYPPFFDYDLNGDSILTGTTTYWFTG
jgi:hypothetical protein